ncbi:MAG: 23S rRNA (pseudouridine(1915)-N(3))-methyltransferase RlmH [Rhodospirillales bacterium]|jgi:23S rRNA (pseudouridine1915-N3)-methyltransferase|nr:23S rRNA (pseudouridine(1915)-N(3))-methyltransferase RlmH [Rhodospirillales bacterium]MBT4040528.1 23S rRNA (pseudouridine(1915)-N(3))-methyltransferase RlmH [Rhodospirillales bacterium]MBT5351362.1 23S rRNA (pseudouridine(1915)-N(3))-methyltransferase RlmH [Rhodospirillales bacterium]MBT5520569.1 23S rRNA (pseudouridine(1915)-N(3))-methyltransferase RlmH [Rhodospirillales bacterium]MBT6111701.1 23S rRNA (pseudouridine(1915)-N(3))-methyltransferase RlmH [Rhodospirillales bacterium]
MQFVLCAVGRIKAGPEKALFEHYTKRLSTPLNVVEVVEKRKLPSHELRVSEAELLSNKIPDGAAVIVFDEKGKEIDSRGLAQLFGDWRDEGRSTTALVIGGADGVDEQLIKRADRVVSLGRMTWPHMLVRGLVAEQLYRAQCIASGHPYHRD